MVNAPLLPSLILICVDVDCATNVMLIPIPPPGVVPPNPSLLSPSPAPPPS